MREYREMHLNYLSEYESNLCFGGIILDGEGLPKEIRYYLSIENRSAANTMVQNDPYYSIYERVIISKFIQRVP